MKTSFFVYAESIQTDFMYYYLQKQKRESIANPNKTVCNRHDSKPILLPAVNFIKLLKYHIIILNHIKKQEGQFQERQREKEGKALLQLFRAIMQG